jgi:hypothetical protein
MQQKIVPKIKNIVSVIDEIHGFMGKWREPRKLAQVLMHVSCIWEVLGLCLGLVTDYPNGHVLLFFSVPPGICQDVALN